MRTQLDRQMQIHQSALNLQAQRQQLLASNIANADTPNYKARDIDFREALKGAVGERMGPLALSATRPGHLQGSGGNPLDGLAKYRTELQSSVDGNTVNMDVERAAFAENAIHYEASITFINGLLSGMQRAITGQ
ncbi:MAG: flagellar basal body rod protein FlgB [Azoarcus sp.]|uniref:Flagellar basal body rod protein FlgB n=1 Tax=Parazoarcus communis TaxID=41977 RepID=A0A2U8GKK6_9RHOO|nr:flagellar basal body rod protein FlgB [Parazoarcus communis]AWI73974.1 flagellar basal body rod protein FlgB [Parazoarcus communis]PKO57319.1 MAG: flagellar basal body rod protein FlgB [Betaproteobacteria bacterium HGW-Betaproteobacteria-19]PLX67774.1 MAG: flagellar basal body rod protein FlgB [Azoarcus sp.]TVT60975.1 MAG: flagellar basal body rod protein FlgB [Azoarcus sp. PHD]